MRTLFYIVLFITPTVLVLVFRQDIQQYLEDKGILQPSVVKEGPKQSGPGSSPDASSRGAGSPETTPPAVAGEKVAGVEGIGAPNEADLERQLAAKYPMPSFQDLETIVGGWQSVPERAYPETVTLKKSVDLQLMINGRVGGKSTLRVGQQAYPIALEGSTLTVSGRPGDSSMKGSIAVDDTDFKDQVREKYASWKQRQEARVHKMRKEEKQRLLTQGAQGNGGDGSASQSAPPAALNLGKEPKEAADGTIPVMVSSIKSGQVKEIQLDKISYWRWIGYEEFGGTGYWTGVVGYTANTMFGEINAEGKALIRDGRVVKWIYSGSEEEIR